MQGKERQVYEVTMPKLSDSMETGKIIEWKVSEGDEVHAGDVLAEVESDKAVMDLECFRDGSIAQISHGDGEEVAVGEVIALIGEGGEMAAEAAPAVAGEGERVAEEPPVEEEVDEEAATETILEEEAEAEEAAPAEAPRRPAPVAEEAEPEEADEDAATETIFEEEQPRPVPPAAKKGKPAPGPTEVAISPYAKKLALQKGIDYTQIKGTGPQGRIIGRDVEEAAAAPAEKKAREKARREKAAAEPPPKAAPDDELPAIEVSEDEADIEEASFRWKTQARRVMASQHVIPHFYLTRAVDVTSLLERREELKEQYGTTVTHLVMFGVLKALGLHPEVNRSYDRGRIVVWKGIHLGLAVDTDDGLTVAVLRNAQDLGLPELCEQTTALVERARAGRLSADQRRHPTFTITNLGMFDVEHFEPIINPPSSVTLAVSSALPTAVVRDDALHIGKVMKLTAACDHRIIDGATAGRFMMDLRRLLESPAELLDQGA
jgi:pyruvate dehydrogenase E2 component (dihydrolipoamide acetyltransferase)